MITIIGDVHGKTQQYQKMLRQRFEGKRTIQIGDMGLGFKGVGLHEMSMDHRWFRGNSSRIFGGYVKPACAHT